jgi:hypothetical protein
VDVDTKELVSAWVLSILTSSPASVITYEVDFSPYTVVTKKIAFKNPWGTLKKYTVLSSDEEVLKTR